MNRQRLVSGATLAVGLALLPLGAGAQDSTDKEKPSLTVYGFVMTDLIGDFDAVDPQWFDMLRPTKLPSVKDQFGKNGNFQTSVRQTRFGVKSTIPTAAGDIFTRFEFDLTGVGGQAGQTQLRLRYAYATLGAFGLGQMDSPFMDLDIFPNTLEAWGPNGMAFFRNIQLRYTRTYRTRDSLVVAIERPGASGDAGAYANRIELSNITPRFPAPDFSAHYRHWAKWGYVELAGILRYIAWDETTPDTLDFSGHTLAWGLNASSRINVREDDKIKLQVLYGEGVENYMNDASIDIGVENNFSSRVSPVKGVTLPVFGLLAFYDHTWTKGLTSSIGYSQVNIQNSNAQVPADFRLGQYFLANVILQPVPAFFFGLEGQWGQRQNKSNGFTANDYRIQFSGKFNYEVVMGGGKKK